MTEVLDYERVGPGHVSFHELDTARRDPRTDPESITLPPSPDFAQVFADWTQVTPEMVEDLPLGLVKEYARRACSHKTVQEVDPGVWYASVVGLEGAYGDGASRDEAAEDLREAIIGWVAVRRRLGLEIPVIEGFDLNVPRPAVA